MRRRAIDFSIAGRVSPTVVQYFLAGASGSLNVRGLAIVWQRGSGKVWSAQRRRRALLCEKGISLGNELRVFPHFLVEEVWRSKCPVDPAQAERDVGLGAVHLARRGRRRCPQ